MAAKTAISEEGLKLYGKFSRSRKPKRRFQVWIIQNEEEWVVKENFDVETKTEGEAFEALQKYVADNFEGSPAAIACKFKALEGPDRRPSDKIGLLVWIPDTCSARLRFVTSQSQAALANKIVANKAWNCSDLSKITYANVLEQVGGAAASKALYSVDPAVEGDDDDDDDE